jgi:hypothetical protein
LSVGKVQIHPTMGFFKALLGSTLLVF